MKRKSAILVAIAVCLAVANTAQNASAHRLPPKSDVTIGLHKICTAIGVCKDRAPRLQYGPADSCTRANDGEVRTIYDDRLGAEVDWQCRCLNETNCTWFRLGIRQSAFTAFWRAQPRNYVLDWMRRCNSIVCKGKLFRHFYPVAYGGHLVHSQEVRP